MFCFHPHPLHPILCKTVLCKVTSNFPAVRSRTRVCPDLLALSEAFDTTDNFLLASSSSLGSRKSALSDFIPQHYGHSSPRSPMGPSFSPLLVSTAFPGPILCFPTYRFLHCQGHCIHSRSFLCKDDSKTCTCTLGASPELQVNISNCLTNIIPQLSSNIGGLKLNMSKI